MNKFIVETSARHIHVTDETLRILCGEDAKLEVKKMLSQPGQFASTTRLNLVGPKGTISGVSILGPTRKVNQVEVSFTDARTLGIVPPIRESGDVKGSSPIKIVGPCGSVELSEGLIVAKRHIHMTEDDAKKFCVHNGEIVQAVLETKDRKLIFDDVVVRVSNNYALAMHIDTDECNAANAAGLVYGHLLKDE